MILENLVGFILQPSFLRLLYGRTVYSSIILHSLKRSVPYSSVAIEMSKSWTAGVRFLAGVKLLTTLQSHNRL
jgi:hypothetical protein